MNDVLYSDIVELIFLSFLISNGDETFLFTLDDMKECVESRYNWAWDKELERRFQLQLENFYIEHEGLIKLPNSNKYIWQNSKAVVLREDRYRSICFASLSLHNDLVVIENLRIANINVEQIYIDSKSVVQRVVRESLAHNTESELPF